MILVHKSMVIPCFFYLYITRSKRSSIILKSKRFTFTYLVVMGVFAALSALQLTRIQSGMDSHYGREHIMIGWSLLGILSLVGAFFSLIGLLSSKPPPKFGECFTLDGSQAEKAREVATLDKERLRRIRRKISKDIAKITGPIALTFFWFCASLFVITLWRVWNTPSPWPMFTSVEVVYLITGSMLSVLVACGLGLKKRWAAVLGYIFAFIQLLWFPVGLISGLLYFITLRKVISYAFSGGVSFGRSWRPTTAQSVPMASKRPVNERLRVEFKQQDAA